MAKINIDSMRQLHKHLTNVLNEYDASKVGATDDRGNAATGRKPTMNSQAEPVAADAAPSHGVSVHAAFPNGAHRSDRFSGV
jgi:hypothetical protein